MTSILSNKKLGNISGWQERHDTAVDAPNAFETPIVGMLKEWERYALTHKRRFESLIGDDYVLGPAWEQIGDSIRTLLNGELGRLDGGTLDAFILGTMKDNAIETENK